MTDALQNADGTPKGVSIKQDVVLKEDGSIDEEATKAKDEQEVSVLLDRLHMSSINNRVFAFSKESQKVYESFTIVLKDMINGAPTAYDDMEKLLRENEGQLGKMFGTMPPFVQTLVKSLPAKLGTSLGPEFLAAASNQPGNDMKARMAAASKTAPTMPEPAPSADGQKKTMVPSVKKLMKEQGAVTGILKSIVNFLQVRFPLLMTGTNVVMSLAVFRKSIQSSRSAYADKSQSCFSFSGIATNEEGKSDSPMQQHMMLKNTK